VQNNIRGTLTDGTDFTTIAPDAPNSDHDLYKRLADRGVNISAENPPEPPWWQTMLTSLIPIAILIGFWFFIMQQSQMGGGRMMNFGKSRVRLMVSDKKKVTFADVAGADEAKQELEEVVEFLKTPDKFNELGARIPKGVLLFGPPGTGKTLLAKAVAGEAGVQFFTISGSDFVEMFVGVGASRVRDLFEQAKKSAPCIVFIDEIDAVGRQRGAGLGGGHDEREQTLNQLLVEMDGFASNEGIIIIAATNRPDVLDPALLRPGRFDRQIVVDKPDVRGREAILKVHTKGKPIAEDADLDVLARRTPGFTGADLSNLVNEAALLAARRNKKKIYMAEMEEAIERVMAGPERKSHVMTEEEKRLTAYHEGGHTLVGLLLEHADPVHKVTIIPRGRAGGYMLSLPKEDRSYRTRSELFDRIKVALGGRVAEEVVLGEISTGASSDIQQATQIIRSMIMQYGMSESIGPIAYGEENHQVFLGRDFNRDRNYSEEVAGEIDREVRRYIEEAYEACRVIITENRDKLDLIAHELLERETLSASELEELMTKGAISDKETQDDTPDDTGKPLMIPVDVVIDDSTQTSEEAERAAEERPAPVPTTEPKFNVTRWNK
ncbi:MAG: ATP-dependent zinc metalloprotease FtsH, partial [Selenomonas massiliensis]